MREFSVASMGDVADEENLTDMVFANAERFAAAISFQRRADDTWHDVTAQEFAADVLTVAKGFIAAGLRTGDRVGLMSRNRYEWTVLDYAIWCAGCVTVPIYQSSSAEQVEWILADSGARGVVVETPVHRDIADSVVERVSTVEHVWQIEAAPDSQSAMEQLTVGGADITDEEVHDRRHTVTAGALATLIYTSGTTGRPKGCGLTHRNLLAEIRAGIAAFPELLRSGNSQLVFLPLAHVFARAIALCGVYARVTLGHTQDVKTLPRDLRDFRPTFVAAVPRVFEKVYNTAKQRAHAEGKGGIFDAAEAVAIAYSEAGADAGLALRLKHTLFDKLVYRKLRTAFGGRCVAAISGGAPLGKRLAHFFRGIGIPVFEGYGLTETCAAAFANTPENTKIGTVGRPIAGTSVRIAADGEVLVAGDVVFSGYWNNASVTEDAIHESWFHTGDIGSLDEDGYLTITGRKKELIVTANGKNVAPAGLEDRLRVHPLISQCMVVGDRRPFIAALITVDEEYFPVWKAQYGKPESATVVELLDDDELIADVQSAVDEANKAVSHAEAIKKFRILPGDFTEESGEMTPSLKLKRNVVSKNYASEIDTLYT